jgi:hypothetical protein
MLRRRFSRYLRILIGNTIAKFWLPICAQENLFAHRRSRAFDTVIFIPPAKSISDLGTSLLYKRNRPSRSRHHRLTFDVIPQFLRRDDDTCREVGAFDIRNTNSLSCVRSDRVPPFVSDLP